MHQVGELMIIWGDPLAWGRISILKGLLSFCISSYLSVYLCFYLSIYLSIYLLFYQPSYLAVTFIVK